MKKSIVALVSALALLLVPMSVYAGAPLPDTDSDCVPDEWDNCVDIANPSQFDGDGDGYGNVCDPDVNQTGVVEFADALVVLGFVGAVVVPGTPPAWMTFSEPPGAAVVFPDALSVLGSVGAVMGVPPLTSGLACASAIALPQPVIPPCTGI